MGTSKTAKVTIVTEAHFKKAQKKIDKIVPFPVKHALKAAPITTVAEFTIVLLASQGKSYKHMMKSTGMNHGQVSYYLKKHKIKLSAYRDHTSPFAIRLGNAVNSAAKIYATDHLRHLGFKNWKPGLLD
jgi:DNA-binding CsgD family transcriptional regulator